MARLRENSERKWAVRLYGLGLALVVSGAFLVLVFDVPKLLSAMLIGAGLGLIASQFEWAMENRTP